MQKQNTNRFQFLFFFFHFQIIILQQVGVSVGVAERGWGRGRVAARPARPARPDRRLAGGRCGRVGVQVCLSLSVFSRCFDYYDLLDMHRLNYLTGLTTFKHQYQ